PGISAQSSITTLSGKKCLDLWGQIQITKPIAITVQGVNIDNGGNDGGDNDGCSGSTGPLSQLTLVSFGLVRQFKRS
ncbi:hypothetical protein QSI17_21420, partial [Aeromonas hydrophila]|uniref:hypothetical protein n=1 Tax=Aeromonas hydrophila TaxID=644 RepID=UPI00256ECD66